MNSSDEDVAELLKLIFHLRSSVTLPPVRASLQIYDCPLL